MTATALYRAPKSALLVVAKSPTEVLTLPYPTGAPTLDPGLEEIIKMATNNVGDMVPVGSYTRGRNVTLSFPMRGYMVPDLLGLRLGYFMASATSATAVAKEITLTGLTINGAGVGQEGNGMPADQAASQLSVLNNDGTVTTLDRIDFAGTPDATEFAQGADGAIKVSVENVGKKAFYIFPMPASTSVEQSEVQTTNLRLIASIICDDNSIWQISSDSAKPVMDGASVDFGAEEFTLQFRLFSDLTCEPYKIKYKGTQQLAAC